MGIFDPVAGDSIEVMSKSYVPKGSINPIVGVFYTNYKLFEFPIKGGMSEKIPNCAGVFLDPIAHVIFQRWICQWQISIRKNISNENEHSIKG